MPIKWNQVPRFALVLSAAWALAAIGRPASGVDAPAVAPTDVPAALAARCDELVRSAVRGPYGWGWTPEVAAPGGAAADADVDEEPETAPKRGNGRPAKAKPKPAEPRAPHKPILIDGRATALIGLELFWAGEL